MKQLFITTSPGQTRQLAKRTAQRINKEYSVYTKNRTQAAIIVLKGILGSGKTEFTKGLAQYFEIKENVLSPTFILMRKFKINKKTSTFQNLWHLDCYRLLPHPDKPLQDLNLGDILNDPQNIVVIEWGEYLKILKQYRTLVISFSIKQERQRKIIIDFL